MQEFTDVFKVPQELILPFPGKLTAMQEFTDVLKIPQELILPILKVIQEFTDILKAPQESLDTAELVLLNTPCR